jgi:hypothetical protein
MVRDESEALMRHLIGRIRCPTPSYQSLIRPFGWVARAPWMPEGRRARSMLLVSAASMFILAGVPRSPIAHQLLQFVQILLIILVCAPLGAFVIRMVPRAAQLPLWVSSRRSQRREVSRWVSAQHTAELEAESGHGVVWAGTCPTCHAPLMMNARHCSACGKALRPEDGHPVMVCPACFATNPASGRFCAECGKPLPRLTATRPLSRE